MNTSQKRLWLILFLVLLAIIIDLPSSFTIDQTILGRKINYSWFRPPLKLGSFTRDLEPKLGLDLAGGTAVTLDTDMSDIPTEDRETALASVKEVISRRVDLFGVSEPNIFSLQRDDTYQLIVELPGLKDPSQALSLIGTTAQLEFLTPVYEAATDSAELVLVDFAPTDLTGKDLNKTSVTFDQTTSEPVVSLEFNAEGKEKFAELTKEYLNKPIAIALDSQIITAPTVQAEIVTGEAIISGDFTVESANALSISLNAGALPVPVTIVSQNTVAPTLGADSISQSVRAGLIGLSIVIVFMALYYGWLGFIASVGLIIYGLITFALYKLIPVTLTLPGIAGFILSVGMAVDSNILIFERYKEERRANRPWSVALELGFGRAWDSIKDANTATLITAFILFNPLNWTFLPTSGPVRGFALTLALGIFISLFTGIFVTRTLLRLFFHPENNQSPSKT